MPGCDSKNDYLKTSNGILGLGIGSKWSWYG